MAILTLSVSRDHSVWPEKSLFGPAGGRKSQAGPGLMKAKIIADKKSSN